MSTYEIPLILFTTLAQLSIGLVLVNTVKQFAGPESQLEKIRVEWLVAIGALLVGMIASVFHLGHPAGMIRTLAHLESAWLSREALLIGLFLVLLLVCVILMPNRGGRGLSAVTAIIGLLALFSMGMTYAPPSFPAINNVLPFVLFLITSLLLGASIGILFAPESKRELVKGILTVGLIVGLVVYFIVPCIWLSGGEIMRQTGESWIASAMYWGRIIIGLAIPLGVIRVMKRIPSWLWVFILVGEIMGRAVFFGNTVHTATNMGGL